MVMPKSVSLCCWKRTTLMMAMVCSSMLFYGVQPFIVLPSPSTFTSYSSTIDSPPSSLRIHSSTSSSSTIDDKYYIPPPPNDYSTVSYSSSSGLHPSSSSRITMRRFLSNKVKECPEYQDLQNILLALELSCKTISNLVNRAGLVYSIKNDDDIDGDTNYSDGRYYSMKRLDKLSTNVLKNALKFTGTVHMMAPTSSLKHEQPKEHQPGVLIASDSNFIACLDPLDGSGNADASICTGTVFGVFRRKNSTTTSSGDNADHLESEILQPGKNMRAAGYCLYSSATVFVFTLGNGEVYGFTLDPQIQEFILTHPNLSIPPRGNVYSCNEANSEGWNSGWKTYLQRLKLGKGETKTRYAHRYVGSMVGDIHRTLLYGGIFAYPSDRIEKPYGNLQLLYKSSPMSFIVHHAGGTAFDEDGKDLLDICPQRIHQKSPCFLGSPQDMNELQSYLKQPQPPQGKGVPITVVVKENNQTKEEEEV